MVRSIFSVFKNSKNILGLNARNLEFIRPHNLKGAKRIADNKLLAKRVLRKAGLSVPKTYKIITSMRVLKFFDPADLPKSFVLKPNRGFGGEGIMLTYNRRKNGAWLDSSLKEIYWSDIKAHIQDILDGRFSLANAPDIAFFEERLVRDAMFKHLAYRGVPDIRVIVYNQVPIMAMMRLPTRESRGKANLHLGGIGVGIDIASGVTTHAVCRDQVLTNARQFSNIKIPEWNNVLSLAIHAQQITGLGYLGIDIVLAKNKGPIVLELNARPGLGIQIANLTGLKERLNRIRGLKVKGAAQGIRLSQELFGQHESAGDQEFQKDILALLKVIETVVLYHKDDPNIKLMVKAKIDSGARSSSIDYELARRLGCGDVVDYVASFQLNTPMTKPEAIVLKKRIKRDLKLHPQISRVKVIRSASGSTVRVTAPIKFKLKDRLIETDVNLISREHLTYDMIIGRRDLEGFLIKPRK
ncbi:MAG: sugar-transfer associated ATP-grasp domain-containing protein [Candidatus Jacksonbacteria bacterium]